MSGFVFPESAVGAFADIGGVIVTMEWHPDPAVISQAIMRVEGYLENMVPPLTASRRIAMQDMEERFDTETDPDGNAWAPLDPDYAAKKESMGGPDKILTWGSDLRSAATSESAFPMTAHEIYFDASGLPEYGLYHESGTGGGDFVHPTTGAFLGGNVGQHRDYRERMSAAGESSRSHVGLGIGRGNALPQRRFIGISAEAEVKIFEVFDLWFAEGVSIYVSGTGIVQQRLPGGRFGPRIF